MSVACVTGAHALLKSDHGGLTALAFDSGARCTLDAVLGASIVATTDHTLAVADGASVVLYDCSTGRRVVTLPLKTPPVLLTLGEKIMAAVTICEDEHVLTVMYLTADSAGLVQDIPVPTDVTVITARDTQAAVLVGHASGLVAEYLLRPSAPPIVRAATARLLKRPPVVIVDDGAGGTITATDSELQLWQAPTTGANARCRSHLISPGILGIVKGAHSAWLRYSNYCQQLGAPKRRRVACNGARGATIVDEQLIVCTTDNRLGTVKCFL